MLWEKVQLIISLLQAFLNDTELKYLVPQGIEPRTDSPFQITIRDNCVLLMYTYTHRFVTDAQYATPVTNS